MPTDYYKPIANAVGRLSPNTVAARRSIYDQARLLLSEEVQQARPPMGVREVVAEQRALEDAIQDVEDEYGAAERTEPYDHPLRRELPPAPPPAARPPASSPVSLPMSPPRSPSPPMPPARPLPAPQPYPEEEPSFDPYDEAPPQYDAQSDLQYDTEPHEPYEDDPRARLAADRAERRRLQDERRGETEQGRGRRPARRAAARATGRPGSPTKVIVIAAILGALFLVGAAAAYVAFFGVPGFRATQQVAPKQKQAAPAPAEDNTAKIRSLMDNASKALEASNPTASIQFLTEAIVLSPKSDAAFTLRGHAYLQAGDPARAVEDFSEAIKLGSRDFYAFIGRAVAYRRLRDYPRAIADYDEAIKIRPDHSGAWNNRCFVHAIAGSLDTALADCNEALRLVPNEPNALDSRALVYLKQGKWDLAIADYEAVLRSAPNTVSAMYGRGYARQKKGDRRGQADISTATTAAPNIVQEFERYGVK